MRRKAVISENGPVLGGAHRSSEPARRALNLLAPTDRWFTEGFENPDLQEVKLLLDQP